MSTRRPEEDASMRWMSGGETAANQNPGAQLPAVQAAAPPNQQQNNVQIPFVKPRLRWSRELHQQFEDAVKELGGPYNATPKDIMNKMGVAEVDRYHIKSHLQKYRNGKTSKRLLMMNAVPAAGGQRNIPENNEPMGTQGYQVESSQKSDEIMTESPPPVSSDKLEKGVDKFPEWAGLVDEDDLEPIVPQVNSLGYTSDPISVPWTRTSPKFGNFFEEVENFPKAGDDYLMDHDDVYRGN